MFLPSLSSFSWGAAGRPQFRWRWIRNRYSHWVKILFPVPQQKPPPLSPHQHWPPGSRSQPARNSWGKVDWECRKVLCFPHLIQKERLKSALLKCNAGDNFVYNGPKPDSKSLLPETGDVLMRQIIELIELSPRTKHPWKAWSRFTIQNVLGPREL